MIKKLTGILLVAFSLNTMAQEKPVNEPSSCPKFSFSFSPMALALSKARLDVEAGIKGNPHILISAAPTFYTGSTSIYSDTRNISPGDDKESSSPDDNISGFGSEFTIKFAKSMNSNTLTLVYGGIGAGFHNIKLSYEDYDWEPYMDNGLEYYRYALDPQKETIKRTDIFAVVGFKAYASKFFFIEGNVGMVYQNSDITTTSSTERPHRNGPIEYGFTGLNLKANLAIGFSIF